jgi:hypothetical protein
LHPDLDPSLAQPFDTLSRGQRPEEDGKRCMFFNEDGDVFIAHEVADQIDAERPVCQFFRLSVSPEPASDYVDVNLIPLAFNKSMSQQQLCRFLG